MLLVIYVHINGKKEIQKVCVMFKSSQPIEPQTVDDELICIII